MNNPLQQLKSAILIIIGMIIFATLFIVGIFVFSYLLIIGAIVGLVIFVIAFVKAKISQRRHRSAPAASKEGRIIEHDDDKTNH